MDTINCIKTVILGESSTGKTSITYRLARDKFNEHMESTIGASFMTKYYDDIKYSIWDTAGQEKYLALVPLYYRNSNLLLLVFDMSNPTTMNRFTYYLDKIIIDLDTEYKILIIGNKCDLVKWDMVKKRIDHEIRQKLAKYDTLKNKIDYVYISTKTGENFEELIDKIKQNGKELTKLKSASYVIDKNTIRITPDHFHNQPGNNNSNDNSNGNSFISTNILNPLKSGTEYCYC